MSIIRGFGARLRQLRLQHNDNQSDLAVACGIKREAVSQWEKGKMMPTHAMVLCLMNRYNVGYKWLVHGTVHRVQIRSMEDVRREIRLLQQEIARLWSALLPRSDFRRPGPPGTKKPRAKK